MSGGLVCDLPDPVDPVQIVEVDKRTGLVRSNVRAELDRGSISDLGYGDNSTYDPQTAALPTPQKLSRSGACAARRQHR